MQMLVRMFPLVRIFKTLEELKVMAIDIGATIKQLVDDVEAQRTTIEGFLTFERTLTVKATEELAAAKALGATDEQLAGLTALHAGITANSTVLANAMAANVPPAVAPVVEPPVPPAPVA